MDLKPEETLQKLQDACSNSQDLLHGDYLFEDTTVAALNGFCYPLAEAMYHLHPGYYVPYRIEWARLGGEGTHWFLKDRTGRILETTNRGGGPVCKPSEYAIAKRQAGFRSPKPSKRCRTLVERAGLTLSI